MNRGSEEKDDQSNLHVDETMASNEKDVALHELIGQIISNLKDTIIKEDEPRTSLKKRNNIERADQARK